MLMLIVVLIGLYYLMLPYQNCLRENELEGAECIAPWFIGVNS